MPLAFADSNEGTGVPQPQLSLPMALLHLCAPPQRKNLFIALFPIVIPTLMQILFRLKNNYGNYKVKIILGFAAVILDMVFMKTPYKVVWLLPKIWVTLKDPGF